MLILLFLLSPLLLGLILFSSRLHRLILNYREAQSLDLPIIVAPFTWQDPVWMIIGPHFSFLRHLPFGLGSWTKYTLFGWQLEDRNQIHSTLGPAFVIVSPKHNEIMVSDPSASEEVLNRYKVWTKSPALYSIFDVFGKNVNSVNGKDWQRHRKITGPAFKEATNELVWDESVNQAIRLNKIWSKGDKVETTLKSILHHNCMVALNVLMVAGFGKSSEGDGDLKVSNCKEKSGSSGSHTLSYGDSLQMVLSNMMMTVLFSALKAPSWLLPSKLRQLRVAVMEFRQYMSEKVTEGKEAALDGQQSKDNLMNALVQANEAAKMEGDAKTVLSDDELYGNMFVFNVAGFETTATALTYTMPFLATHPEVQEWLAEEVQDVLGGQTTAHYQDIFPRLIRTMAVMYETLRKRTAVQALPRFTAESQELQIGGRSYTVPSQTYITANFNAMHHDPTTWGPDVDDWRPQRWIQTSATGEETFAGPPQGAGFVAWSHGPRVCPGKRFSQVEFAAVISVMVRDYRVTPAKRGEESEVEARERLARTLKDSYFNMSPKVRRPLDAGLSWIRR